MCGSFLCSLSFISIFPNIFSPNYVIAFVYCGTELILELTENFQQLCAFSCGFHSLVIMNSAAKNLHVQAFMWT